MKDSKFASLDQLKSKLSPQKKWWEERVPTLEILQDVAKDLSRLQDQMAQTDEHLAKLLHSKK